MGRFSMLGVLLMIVVALLASVGEATPPGIAKNPSKATCKIKKYKYCYNLEHVCPKFCPDSCYVHCASCKPICGVAPEPSPSDDSPTPSADDQSPPSPDQSNPTPSTPDQNHSPLPSPSIPYFSPPPPSVPSTPSTPDHNPPPSPSSPTPSTPDHNPSPSPSPSVPNIPSTPDHNTPPSPSVPSTPSTPHHNPSPTPSVPSTTSTPNHNPPPSSPTPSTPDHNPSPSPSPSPSVPNTPSTPDHNPPPSPSVPSTPSTPDYNPSPSPSVPSTPSTPDHQNPTPYTPSPSIPTPSTPDHDPSPSPSTPTPSTPSSPSKARCWNKDYPTCYNTEHVCPKACPGGCEVDCKTCKPICKCDQPGAVCQDPRFIGGDGVTFYFHGKKDSNFCLVSDPNLHINAHFIGKRNHNMGRDFTWVQSIAILFHNHQIFLGAQKTATWDDSIDRLALAFDGQSLALPQSEGATWASNTSPRVFITRAAESNNVVVEIEGKLRITAKVVPITEEDSRIHNYGITQEDCFAHLDLGFKFLSLSDKVSGVLGQTYRPDYVSRVNIKAKMPVMGGNREFATTSLFAPDCSVSRFVGKNDDNEEQGSMEVLELPSMKCASGIDGQGVVCKR